MKGLALGIIFIVKLAFLAGGVYHAFEFDPHFGWTIVLLTLGVGLRVDSKLLTLNE